MSATDQTSLLQNLQLHEELRTTVDERTLQILDRRRRTGVVKRRGWLVRRMLLTADVFGLVSALLLAEWLAPAKDSADTYSPQVEILAFLLTVPAWVVITKLYGLYDRDDERANHSTADDFGGVFHMVTVCTWLVIVITYLSNVAHPTPQKLVVFWAVAIAFVCVARAGARALARRNAAYIQNTVIVGAGDVGQLFAKKVLNHPEYGINLVGFVDAKPKERRKDLEHVALLGETGRLPAIVRLLDVERVIVAFSNDSHEETLELLRAVKDLEVQIDIVPRLFEFVGPGVEIHTVEGLPLLGLPPLRLSRSSRLLKRATDLALTIPALVLLAPLFALLALMIKLDSPGPVFFRQVRRGAAGRTFRIFKFRSMHADAEERKHEVAHLNRHLAPGGDPRMFKIVGDPRVTRVGKLLRRFSLDELPQLLNVLIGQMSLVGPRPLILDEDEHVERWARQRLNLKPGVTGLWQVLGRSEIPFAEMIRLDYLYVTRWSLMGDLRLMALTIPALLRRSTAD
ncbi:MAG: exopolysaccharide biosynthesis polyprenyl glycosylphosphotransferase [Thermoleophilaceae bacterium]